MACRAPRILCIWQVMSVAAAYGRRILLSISWIGTRYSAFQYGRMKVSELAARRRGEDTAPYELR